MRIVQVASGARLFWARCARTPRGTRNRESELTKKRSSRLARELSRLKGERELAVLFFFSSRRRHTRCSRDWSSDVCSSDLSSSTIRGASTGSSDDAASRWQSSDRHRRGFGGAGLGERPRDRGALRGGGCEGDRKSVV